MHGVALGMDTFDCAMPTRLGRHGVAIVPDPDARWRVDLTAARHREVDEPIMEGCPCEACPSGPPAAISLPVKHESRRPRAGDAPQPGFVAGLMEGLRTAIAQGTLAAYAAAQRAGAAP